MNHFHSNDLAELAREVIRSRQLNANPNQLHLQFIPSVEDFDGPDDTVCYRYHTDPWMSNPNGVTHGGMVAAILDTSMGMTSTCYYHVLTPTISMNVNYCLPVPLNADILVKARLVRAGRTSAQLMAEMYLPGEPDKVLATSTGVYHTAHAQLP